MDWLPASRSAEKHAEAGVPDKPAVGLLGWEAGVPAARIVVARRRLMDTSAHCEGWTFSAFFATLRMLTDGGAVAKW